MKTELRYTLLTDGSSDVALLPILNWLLIENGVSQRIQHQWVDFRLLRKPPRDLVDRIRLGLELYPCDLLVIHRDAEKSTLDERASEINAAIERLEPDLIPPNVFVIPVRMTEAWLLFDEHAIRFAAGNQNGHIPLDIPDLSSLESISDPKAILYELIEKASGLRGRRLKRFNPAVGARRIADSVSDFAPLRSLAAFRSLERDIIAFIEYHW